MKKKIIIFLLIGMLSFSTFGLALEETNTEPLNTYTHTVLAEQGTATWCGYCPAVSGYLSSIYTGGGYNWEYVALVDDMNADAAARVDELGLTGFPTVFFDGGARRVVGDVGSTAPYIAALDYCGALEVKDIDLTTNVVWDGNDQITVNVDAQSNDPPNTEILSGPEGLTNNDNPTFTYDVGGAGSTYYIRSYVTEIESRWLDADGIPYDHAFIGYAYNQDISLGTFSDSTTFSYGSISSDNIKVVTAIFDPGNQNRVVQTHASVPALENNYSPTNFDDPTFSYILEGYETEWSEWTTDKSVQYNSLPNGEYTFKVKAQTFAGEDPTPAEISFSLDAVPPETTITSGPSGAIDYNNVQIEFEGTDDTSEYLLFKYKLEGLDSDWSNWEQTNVVTYSGLPDTSYTFLVKAKDAAHNEDPTPANISFTVDTGTGPQNNAPNTPNINGPSSGEAGTEYDFTIFTTDPEFDNVYYYVEWGDGAIEEWIGSYASGDQITISHTWTEEDTFTIKAKAKDLQGAESDWAYFEVSMPKNKEIFTWNWFIELLINYFPWLDYIL